MPKGAESASVIAFREQDGGPVVFESHRLGQRGPYGGDDEHGSADGQRPMHSGSFRWFVPYDERRKREPADNCQCRQQTQDSCSFGESSGTCRSCAAKQRPGLSSSAGWRGRRDVRGH